MIKLLLLAVLSSMLLVNVHAMTCHYEALPVNSTDCPLGFHDFYPDEVGAERDYDGMNSDEECPLDPNDGDAESLFNGGTLICEADMKLHMKQYEHEFNDHYWGPNKFSDLPVGNMTETDWDTRPEGTNKDENNCGQTMDYYYIRCSADVGGEDCKPLDETACAAQPDSCRATTRSGKFRKCKPKRCKPMTETECEAAVHCEKKLGRTGNYKKCRRINSSRAN